MLVISVFSEVCAGRPDFNAVSSALAVLPGYKLGNPAARVRPTPGAPKRKIRGTIDEVVSGTMKHGGLVALSFAYAGWNGLRDEPSPLNGMVLECSPEDDKRVLRVFLEGFYLESNGEASSSPRRMQLEQNWRHTLQAILEMCALLSPRVIYAHDEYDPDWSLGDALLVYWDSEDSALADVKATFGPCAEAFGPESPGAAMASKAGWKQIPTKKGWMFATRRLVKQVGALLSI